MVAQIKGGDGAAAPTFGQILKSLRESAGITQEQLANRSGLHLGAVFKLEQGRREPAWSTVQALCRALGVGCSSFENTAPHIANRPTPGRGRPRKVEVSGQGERPADPSPSPSSTGAAGKAKLGRRNGKRK